MIFRQNKGRGIAVLIRTSYIEKYCNTLTSDQFKVIEITPQKRLKAKSKDIL